MRWQETFLRIEQNAECLAVNSPKDYLFQASHSTAATDRRRVAKASAEYVT